MYSLIHTPILPQEIQAAFRLTPEIYAMAMDYGALSAGYSDTEDPVQRLSLHNLSDVVSFAVLLALGWPVRPVSLLSEQADAIADDLWHAWEECLGDTEHVIELSSSHAQKEPILPDQPIEIIRSSLFSAIRDRDDLSIERKACLQRHIVTLIQLVQVVTETPIRAVLNQPPAQRRTENRPAKFGPAAFSEDLRIA